MTAVPQRQDASFENHEKTRQRTVTVLRDVPDVADWDVDDVLEQVAHALAMPLVLAGHVGATTYTLVAFHARDAHAGLTRGDTIPIGETYCREEITADKPFVLGDAELDSRFAHHPGYRKHGFRAYAGAPLVLTDGTVFGTLCGVDTKPNWASLPGIEQLVVLAEELSDRISQRLDLPAVQRPRRPTWLQHVRRP